MAAQAFPQTKRWALAEWGKSVLKKGEAPHSEQPGPLSTHQDPGCALWKGGPCGPGAVALGAQLTVSVLPLQYQVESAQLVTRRLQVSVWHLGMLARRVFLGEVIIPLATWDFEDSATQSFRWYQLRAKVTSGLGLSSPHPRTMGTFRGIQEEKTYPGSLGPNTDHALVWL